MDDVQSDRLHSSSSRQKYLVPIQTDMEDDLGLAIEPHIFVASLFSRCRVHTAWSADLLFDPTLSKSLFRLSVVFVL